MLKQLTTLAVVLVLAAPADASAETVHLYGDSIHMGWGFGFYDHPSFLERIDLTANVLAETNGSALRFRRAGTQDPARICQDVSSGLIAPNDYIVFEDAGPRTWYGEEYRAWLEQVVACSGNPSRLILGTMFDYGPNLEASEYDVPLIEGYTTNDLLRQLAATHGTLLVDWNAMMDVAHDQLEPLGVKVVHKDGIHPTVWGNVLMAASLVQLLDVDVSNVDAVGWEAVTWKWQIIPQGNAPSFDREEAMRWSETLVDAARPPRPLGKPQPIEDRGCLAVPVSRPVAC